MSQYSVNPENQVIGLSILSEFAIYPSAELQCLRISDGLQGRNDGANGCEFVERLCRSVLASRSRSYLPVAGGDIVANSKAKDVVERILIFG